MNTNSEWTVTYENGWYNLYINGIFMKATITLWQLRQAVESVEWNEEPDIDWDLVARQTSLDAMVEAFDRQPNHVVERYIAQS